MWLVRLKHDQYHDQIIWYSDTKLKSGVLSELVGCLKHYKGAAKNDFIICANYMIESKVEFGFYQIIAGSKNHIVEFEMDTMNNKSGIIDITHISKKKS